MAIPEPPDPVKRVLVLLWSDGVILARARERCEDLWGAVDYEGDAHSFDPTSYYTREMGADLHRQIISFAALMESESLVGDKLASNRIEDRFCTARGRSVNLDVGYLDVHKLVLASGKGDGHKIHLGEGIYADALGRYSKGEFSYHDWAFPDFRDGRYDRDLLAIRERYKRQLRAR